MKNGRGSVDPRPFRDVHIKLRCKAYEPLLRCRICSSRRYAIEPRSRLTVRRRTASDEGDTAAVEVTECDVVRDQAFTCRDLPIRSVVNDVTLVVRVIRQFSKERIQLSPDLVGRDVAELVDQNCL